MEELGDSPPKVNSTNNATPVQEKSDFSDDSDVATAPKRPKKSKTEPGKKGVIAFDEIEDYILHHPDLIDRVNEHRSSGHGGHHKRQSDSGRKKQGNTEHRIQSR